MRAFALLALLFVVSGCLEVDSIDGTLVCSTVPGRECPHGFYCLQPNNACWRQGHVPADMARSYDLADAAPDDLSVPVQPDVPDMTLPPTD